MSLRFIDGTAPILITADHAGSSVPAGVDLGVDPALMRDHVAVDIGTEALAIGLARALAAPAIIATVSRLVIDLNREPEAPGLIPMVSDGHVIHGNALLTDAERDLRLTAIHNVYHDRIAHEIAARRPHLLVSLHSFTPALATRPDEDRPWPVGILYNRDDRAARHGIAALAAPGLHVGDNQPYSGRTLNYTMNRHAEAAGIPYLGVEIRNDGLGDAAAVRHWVHVLADTVNSVCRAL